MTSLYNSPNAFIDKKSIYFSTFFFSLSIDFMGEI